MIYKNLFTSEIRYDGFEPVEFYDCQIPKIICPNTVDIVCVGCGVESLTCDKAINIYCGNNRLTELKCDNALYVSCPDNLITNISCPNAQTIVVFNNPLEDIYCPKVELLKCQNTRLTYIDCPMIKSINYDIYHGNQLIVIPILPTIDYLGKQRFNYPIIKRELNARNTKSSRLSK